MNIAEKLIETARPLSTGCTITDVRLGLGYTLVEINDGSAGVAWTPDKKQSSSCTHLSRAGSLVGMAAGELLTWLKSDNFLERAIGLATFNAINSVDVSGNSGWNFSTVVSPTSGLIRLRSCL